MGKTIENFNDVLLPQSTTLRTVIGTCATFILWGYAILTLLIIFFSEEHHIFGFTGSFFGLLLSLGIITLALTKEGWQFLNYDYQLANKIVSYSDQTNDKDTAKQKCLKIEKKVVYSESKIKLRTIRYSILLGWILGIPLFFVEVCSTPYDLPWATFVLIMVYLVPNLIISNYFLNKLFSPSRYPQNEYNPSVHFNNKQSPRQIVQQETTGVDGEVIWTSGIQSFLYNHPEVIEFNLICIKKEYSIDNSEVGLLCQDDSHEYLLIELVNGIAGEKTAHQVMRYRNLFRTQYNRIPRLKVIADGFSDQFLSLADKEDFEYDSFDNYSSVEKKARYCLYCGRTNHQRATFCVRCGKPTMLVRDHGEVFTITGADLAGSRWIDHPKVYHLEYGQELRKYNDKHYK